MRKNWKFDFFKNILFKKKKINFKFKFKFLILILVLKF
jgi:hypothetical protein